MVRIFPEALWHVYISSPRAPELQSSRVQCFRYYYLDLKEGSDGAHLIASVEPFQTLGPEYEMHFWPIDLLHFGIVSSEEVAFRVP